MDRARPRRPGLARAPDHLEVLHSQPSHLQLESATDDTPGDDKLSFQQETHRFQGQLLKKTLEATPNQNRT